MTGADFGDGVVRIVPNPPKLVAVFRIRRPVEPLAAKICDHFFERLGVLSHTCVTAMKLNEQVRLFRQAQIPMCVHRRHACCIQQLYPCHRNAKLDRRDHCIYGVIDRFKGTDRCADGLRLPLQAQGEFCD